MTTILALLITTMAPPLQRDSETTRTVGWGYLRMNETTALASMAENAAGDQSVTLKRGLLPSGERGRLSRITLPKPVVGRKDGTTRSQIAAFRTGAPSWSAMYAAEPTKDSLNIGTGSVGGSQPTAVYHGIATKDGSLYIGKIDKGPFFASKVKTYTGYWNSGVPEVGAEKTGDGGSLSVPVKAGQEFEITFNMYTKVAGSYSDEVVLANGNITHLSLSGKVNPVDSIPFSAAWADSGFNFAPGHTYTKNLKVLIGGSQPVKVRVTDESKYEGYTSPYQISATETTINPNVPTSIPVRFTIKASATDKWNLSVPLSVSAFSGQKKLDVNANIHIETLWVVHQLTKTFTDTIMSELKFKYKSKFMFNSSGAWFLDLDIEPHSDFIKALFRIETTVDGSGKKPALRVRQVAHGDWGSGEYVGSLSGWNENVRKVFDSTTNIKLKVETEVTENGVMPPLPNILLFGDLQL